MKRSSLGIGTLFMCAAAAVQLRAELIPLAPEEETFVGVGDFFVSFRIAGDVDRVRKIKMFFDDEDISPGLRRTGVTVSFLPDDAFIKRPDIDGPHTVTILLYGPYNAELERKVIRFYLHKEAALSDGEKLEMLGKGKSLRGATVPEVVNTGKLYTGITSDSYRDSNVFAGIADAQGNGYGGDWFYNYNISLNTQEDKRRQTLQRFRFATGYTQHIQASFGDNWPAYNYYLLDGQCIRGVEFNLKTPKHYANLDFVFGKVKRAIHPYLSNNHALDSALSANPGGSIDHNDSAAFFENGTYGRRMWATRLHFCSGKVFKLGISLLKAKDDSSSIMQRFRMDTTYRRDTVDTTVIDTIIGRTIVGETPKDNIVIGSDIAVNLWKRRIALFSNLAFSLYTDNILGGALTEEEISAIAGTNITTVMRPKDIDHLFIVNGTTVPLSIPSDSGRTVNMGSLMNASVLDAGIRVYLPMQSIQQTFEFKYFFIGPNFHSLGNEYLSINKAGIQLTDEMRLCNGKILMKGDLKYYKDDLHSVKTDPTRKIAFNFLTTCMWSNSLPLITLSFLSNDETTAASRDTPLPSRNNGFNQVGTIIQYARAFESATHTATLSYNFNSYDSRIHSILSQTNYSLQGNNGTVMITSGFNDLPIRTRASVSGFFSTGDYSVNRLSPAAGLTWNIKPQTMHANADIGFEHINDAVYDSENYWSAKSSFGYDVSNRHSLYAEAGLHWQLEKRYIDPHLQITYEYKY